MTKYRVHDKMPSFLIGNVGENCHALKNPPGRHCAKKMLHKLNWKSIKKCPRTHFVHERMSEKKRTYAGHPSVVWTANNVSIASKALS